MIQLYKLALRDLLRNRRRSFFSALALAIGLALLLFGASFFRGEMRQSMDNSIRLQSGHIQVRAKAYDENKTSLAWEDLIENPERISSQVASLDPVKVATPRLYASGIVATGDESIGVRIMGIDPASEANAPFREGMLSGKFLAADDREGILIGKSLADKLGINEGQQITLLVNTSNGDVDEQAFIVRGVFTTHTPGFDQATVFMPLAKAQAISKAENHASIIFVLLKNSDQTSNVIDALKTSQYQVLTYKEMNQVLSDTEQFSQAYLLVIYLIVLAITATVIINTLIMSVYERTREIGILAAIGMKATRIMAMFFAESSLLAIGGIVMGLTLGSLMVLYSTKVGFFIGNMGVTGILIGERIYGYLTASDAVTLTITAFVITLLAALYPAMLAAQMEPIEALHGGKK
jgi:ABC-type lipoprotein release transport system permease subunit